MSFKPVTHVLFDMDGLLLNTEDLYTIGFDKIASKYGKEFTYGLKCKIMGKQSKEIAQTLINELELPLSVDEFTAESKKVFRELFPQCEVMEGAKRLLDHLKDHNIPFGLATSSSKESYDMKTKHHEEFFDMFQYKTWGSSDPLVKRGKPYPDVFLVAANKFPEKPKPVKCLVFEDSVNGVRAARAAGMQVVMVPDSKLDRTQTLDATLVIDSLTQFQPEQFGLPPYSSS